MDEGRVIVGGGVWVRRDCAPVLPPSASRSLADTSHARGGGRTRAALAGAGGARGWVLLEVMLALSIFTMAALALLSVMGQAAGNVEVARLEREGLDLARSALAKLEAGLKSAEELRGPAPVWSQYETEPGAEAFEDELPEPSGWELEVETEPSQFAGLTLVSVTAMRRDASGEPGFATTLRQLVRLSARAEDTIGEQDQIGEAAERGARGGGR